MKRKDGSRRSDYNIDLNKYILDILQDLEIGTPETIRKEISNKIGYKPHWLTIKRHLDDLERNNQVKKKFLLKGIKRNIRVYSIVTQ